MHCESGAIDRKRAWVEQLHKLTQWDLIFLPSAVQMPCECFICCQDPESLLNRKLNKKLI